MRRYLVCRTCGHEQLDEVEDITVPLPPCAVCHQAVLIVGLSKDVTFRANYFPEEPDNK